MPTFSSLTPASEKIASIFLSRIYSHANDLGAALTNIFQNPAQTPWISLLPLDPCQLPTYRLMSTLKILTATKQNCLLPTYRLMPTKNINSNKTKFPSILSSLSSDLPSISKWYKSATCLLSFTMLTPLYYLVLLLTDYPIFQKPVVSKLRLGSSSISITCLAGVSSPQPSAFLKHLYLVF